MRQGNLKVVRNKELVRWGSVTKNDIEAAFVEWDKNPHPWHTADKRQRAVQYNNKCYPPKEIARLAIELKEGLPVGQLQRDGLTVQETKNVFEKLGFKYIYASKCKDTITLSSKLSHHLIKETASSRPGAIQLPQTNRANLIRSVRGKYSFVQTSSDEFAKRKQIEINLEG